MRSIVSHTVVAARSCIADQPTGIRQTSILRNRGEDKVKLIFSLNQYNELTFKKEICKMISKIISKMKWSSQAYGDL